LLPWTGAAVALSEAERRGHTFLTFLIQRGLHAVSMIGGDAHAGLEAPRKTVFASIPWQQCQFHLQQNAQAYVRSRLLS
jgi:putative transposase